MRFFVGFGVGGLYCVDLPLVQEFVPARMRGFIGGLVTVFIPLGVMIASSFAAFFTDAIGWRGLFLIGLLPAAFTLVDPRLGAGIAALAHEPGPPRRSTPLHRLGVEGDAGVVAVAERAAEAGLPRPGAICSATRAASPSPGWRASARRPRRYGIILWAPTLFVLQLGVTPAYAAYLFLWVSLAGIAGRISFRLAVRVHRPPAAGMIVGFGGTVCIAAAGSATT